MLVKVASAKVLEARIARKGQGLFKDAHRADFNYDPRPGYLYVRSRAISSRINDNYDGFPAGEIKKAYRTFIGKPVFVNHHNENHRRARGVIKDAVLHEDVTPSGDKDTWVEVLMEIDAVKFPKLAQAILAGHIERTSMGCDVEYSVCTACGNKASTPLQYCAHIPKQKGMKLTRTTASGKKQDVLIAEQCYGLTFFENSLLVEDPADPTAFFLGVDDRGLAMTGSTSGSYGQTISISRGGTGGSYSPAMSKAASKVGYGEVKAPEKVNTLREEACPICAEREMFDGEECSVCLYKKPPDDYMDPDLSKAQEEDDEADEEEAEEEEEKKESRKNPVRRGQTPQQRVSKIFKEKNMRPRLAALARNESPIIKKQKRQIAALTEGFRYIASVAGMSSDPKVRALLKAAMDDENPANGYGWANPGPSAEEAPEDTSSNALGDVSPDTEGGGATDSVETIGETSESDTSPDAVTDLEGGETLLDVLDYEEDQDVTEPVAGTDTLGQGEAGEPGTNHTEVEVVHDPVQINDPETPWPLEEGGWDLSASQQNRTMASLRLAKLRIKAGIAKGDDLALGTKIAQSKASTAAINAEIQTLEKVTKARKNSSSPRPRRNLVPRSAKVERTVPSLQAFAQGAPAASAVEDDEFLFD